MQTIILLYTYLVVSCIIFSVSFHIHCTVTGSVVVFFKSFMM